MYLLSFLSRYPRLVQIFIKSYLFQGNHKVEHAAFTLSSLVVLIDNQIFLLGKTNGSLMTVAGMNSH